MAEQDSCDESDVGDISAGLDRIEASYALKIQEYRALIRMKSRGTAAFPGSTPDAGTDRIPDVIYRPRRAA
jgi:hypothetical protein